MPKTEMSVATNCVTSTAPNRMFAGRMLQNGPRVRVTKMVKCPATESYMAAWHEP
jgi:hypothetical protein